MTLFVPEITPTPSVIQFSGGISSLLSDFFIYSLINSLKDCSVYY